MNERDFIIGYFDKKSVTFSLHRQLILFLIVGGICVFVDMAILSEFS